MKENLHSKRTKQENTVKAVIHPFQKTFKQSQTRIRSSSSMHTLAKSTYSAKQNRMMTPKKSVKYLPQTSVISKMPNPQGLMNDTLKGLHSRTTHIPNFSDWNTELLENRKKLQNYLSVLKEKCKKEEKQTYKHELNCKKINNQIEQSRNNIKQLQLKQERLNHSIAEETQECSVIKSYLKEINKINNEKATHNQIEDQVISKIEIKSRYLKNDLLVGEHKRVQLKANLKMRQTVMIERLNKLKQLEDTKANLLLSINKSVAENRLQ